MGATAALALPYPEPGDQADGPGALDNLASAVESYFYNRSLPSGVTRMPSYFWGTVATFPTGSVQPGDTCVISGVTYVYVSASGGWAAQRQTFVQATDPGNVPDGTVWFQPQ